MITDASKHARVHDAPLPGPRSAAIDLAIVVTAALTTRIISALVVPPLTGDAGSFFDLARSVLHGHGFSSATAAPWLPSFERPPAYPLFIAAVWELTGEHVSTLIGAQILVDVAATALLYLFARDRFGRAAALAAAGLYALLPFAAGMSVLTYSESLAGAFVILAAWAHERAIRSPRHAFRFAALAGASWGTAALNRPYLSPLTVVAAIVLWWELRSAHDGRPLFHGLALLTVAGLVVAPWTIRNAYWAHRLNQPFYVFQPLGSSPPYTSMYTPGFLAWMRSHEEPFVWSAWNEAPRSPYLDDAERREVAVLFAELRAHDGVVSVEMDRGFQHVADERYRKAPFRCYVWRRISSALKYWGSPRVSTVAMTVTGTPGTRSAPRWLLLLFVALSWSTTLLFALGMIVRRSRTVIYPAAIAVATTIVLVEVGLGEARYLMPIFGLVCAGAGRAAAQLVTRGS
jgi:4-amino-4-deoxy-L-arabinose transferase-like glycosyltransferase